MAKVNGATLLARTLRRAGAGPIFTLSGHQILPIYDAGLDADLRFVDTRHENAAVHLADGWGRLTGATGLALVTAAPGFTNALTGAATALHSESPLLLVSGGVEVPNIGRGGFQELAQVRMIEPIVKAAAMPRAAGEIPTLVARASREALAGVPGPVHLTLPYDVLHEAVEEGDAPLPPTDAFAAAPVPAAEADVARLLDLLAAARRPIVLASPSATRGAAGLALRELSDLAGLPWLPIDSAVGLAEPALHGLARLLPTCDLVVVFGKQDFAIGFADERTVAPAATLVQVHPDRREIARNRAVALGVIADAAPTLSALLAAARGRPWPRGGWAGEVAAARAAQLERTRPFEAAADLPLHPARVVAAVRAWLRPGDCVALDGGDFVRWARWGLGAGPYELLTNGKLGALGPGLPLAMAAALARPEARSVAFIGDGTAGFHLLEFDTAVRHGIPFVAIVGNDAGWGTERHRQAAVYGPDRLVAADLLPTRYDRLAVELGAHGEHVARPEELAPALERAFASGRPACVNVAVAGVGAPSVA